MIPRIVEQQIWERLDPGKVVVVYGPRQTGKTTLLREIERREIEMGHKTLWLNGDEVGVRKKLGEASSMRLGEVVRDYDLIIIDEAQRVEEIGLKLKIIVDTFAELRVLVSGSSAFDLARQVGEPLVGRKWQFMLYPVAQVELRQGKIFDRLGLEEGLEERLICGSYPVVFGLANLKQKAEYMKEIADGYLFKDILELDGLRNSRKVWDIARMLAWQIGHEVSVSEVARGVELSRNTVYKYLDLLEKAFVIRRVGGYSRNLRNEIKKNDRYYFWDNGVRNALVDNFNSLDLRNDVGQLWENFVVMERVKKLAYQKTYRNVYFWRTHEQQEVDIVEEGEGKIWGYEVSWRPERKTAPPQWRQGYPEASWQEINKENYLEFVA